MATRSRHTPGPWRAENESAEDQPDAGNSDIWIGTDGGGHSIAHIGRDPGLTHDQHMANARLIAKAPELLAVIHQMLALRAPATIEHDAARQVARALIAEIEGGG